MALIALAPFRRRRMEGARHRGRDFSEAWTWLVAMQSRNGGWGAFDKDNTNTLLTKIPFCDFGEALDPPSVDVTAHIIEAFGKLGISREHPAMVRALRYIRDQQEPDGPWFGRWGVNYIYGTGAVLPALEAIGEDMRQPYIARACDWIVARQQAKRRLGRKLRLLHEWRTAPDAAETTASQTAWALMALLAANREKDREAIERGCHSSARDSARGNLARAAIHWHGFSRLWRGPDDQTQRSPAGGAAEARAGAFARLHAALRHVSPLLPADGPREGDAAGLTRQRPPLPGQGEGLSPRYCVRSAWMYADSKFSADMKATSASSGATMAKTSASRSQARRMNTATMSAALATMNTRMRLQREIPKSSNKRRARRRR